YEVDTTAGFEDRLAGLLEIRAQQWESFGPYLRMTLARKWRYKVLAENYDRQMSMARKDMVRWLPELAKLSPEKLLAAETATSFEVWHRLRTINGQSEKQAKAVLRATLLALLGK
ncbi:MAG: TetR/AcrR family transcriptional regulator, partial [Alphaproteobacteria bacterium]